MLHVQSSSLTRDGAGPCAESTREVLPALFLIIQQTWPQKIQGRRVKKELREKKKKKEFHNRQKQVVVWDGPPSAASSVAQ